MFHTKILLFHLYIAIYQKYQLNCAKVDKTYLFIRGNSTRKYIAIKKLPTTIRIKGAFLRFTFLLSI